MKINVGSADRIIRITAGLAVIIAGIYFQTWWGVVGIVPLLTGLTKTCPVYMPFGISTCKEDTVKQK